MKKLFYQLHGWLGLNFGLVLFIICLSGTFAVVSHEIDWLCNPAIRVTPNEERASWATMFEAAGEYADGSFIRSGYAPKGSRFAAEFLTKDKRGNTRRIYIDPYRGTATGDATWMNSQRFFRDFHRRFYISAGWGIWVVSVYAFVLSLAGITGLSFYGRWWKQLWGLRFRSGWRVFFSDLHRKLGVWTLLFSLIISVTGFWYLFEKTLTNRYRAIQRADNSARTQSEESSDRPVITPNGQRLPVDELLDHAERAMPGFRVTTISMPSSEKRPVRFSGQATAWLVRQRSNWLELDPYTGTLIGMQRAEELPAFERLTHTADPLHFGNFAGLTSKLIWFAFGLLLSALIPTGVYLWVKRRSSRLLQVVRKRGCSSLEMLTEIHLAVRRQYWAGMISTVVIFGLAVSSTWEALKKQYYSSDREGSLAGMGEPGVIVIYGSFMVFILFASWLWFRWIWMPSPFELVAQSAIPDQPAAADGGGEGGENLQRIE